MEEVSEKTAEVRAALRMVECSRQVVEELDIGIDTSSLETTIASLYRELDRLTQMQADSAKTQPLGRTIGSA